MEKWCSADLAWSPAADGARRAAVEGTGTSGVGSCSCLQCLTYYLGHVSSLSQPTQRRAQTLHKYLPYTEHSCVQHSLASPCTCAAPRAGSPRPLCPSPMLSPLRCPLSCAFILAQVTQSPPAKVSGLRHCSGLAQADGTAQGREHVSTSEQASPWMGVRSGD